MITMQIAKCGTYHAKTVGIRMLRMPDKKSVFKIYYLSIISRDLPEQFEWEHCRQKPDSFERAFLLGKHEGIGFVVAFPHIAKVFRFSPYGETIIDVSEFHTADMQPKDCSRGDGSHEFACYAESIIAADEYQSWANAATVEQYLASRCTKTDFPIVSNTKLTTFWERT
jgi:hypothetical protein